jgi:hypothetical protein
MMCEKSLRNSSFFLREMGVRRAAAVVLRDMGALLNSGLRLTVIVAASMPSYIQTIY